VRLITFDYQVMPLGAEYCINLCDMMWRMWIDAGFEMFVSDHSCRLNRVGSKLL